MVILIHQTHLPISESLHLDVQSSLRLCQNLNLFMLIFDLFGQRPQLRCNFILKMINPAIQMLFNSLSQQGQGLFGTLALLDLIQCLLDAILIPIPMEQEAACGHQIIPVLTTQKVVNLGDLLFISLFGIASKHLL